MGSAKEVHRCGSGRARSGNRSSGSERTGFRRAAEPSCAHGTDNHDPEGSRARGPPPRPRQGQRRRLALREDRRRGGPPPRADLERERAARRDEACGGRGRPAEGEVAQLILTAFRTFCSSTRQPSIHLLAFHARSESSKGPRAGSFERRTRFSASRYSTCRASPSSLSRARRRRSFWGTARPSRREGSDGADPGQGRGLKTRPRGSGWVLGRYMPGLTPS